MKVLVISYMFPCKRHPISGIFFANLLKELATKLDELVVITPRPYIPKFFLRFNKSWNKWFIDPLYSVEDGIKIFRPYVLTLRGVRFLGINGILWHYSLLRMTKNIIKKNRIDVIIGHNMLPEGITAGNLASKMNLPFITWCIGTDINDFAYYNFINKYLTKKCISDSSITLTTSKALAERVRHLNQSSDIKCFYRGIKLDHLKNLPSKKEICRQLELTDAFINLLFVGRIIRDKGIYELAEAFFRISKQYTNLNLIMIGDEIEKSSLSFLFDKMGISDKVHFTGIIQHDKVALYMKCADIMILPTWAEGLPNVVIEAMAVGIPVVATAVGGIPEILEHEVTGLLVPARNVDKLTDAITRMLDDSALRETCTANAKKLVYENFDVKKNVNLLYDMLVEIKNNHSHH